MKRHPALYPLSWQHHNGLMATLLLKKGVRRNADVTAMKEFIVYLWETELEGHFEAEEKELSEILEKNPDGKTFKNRLLKEHQKVRELIRHIKLAASTSAIQLFYEQLELHIRFEERDLFPFIEKLADKNELDHLKESLSDLPSASCVNYPVKFWEN